MEALNPMDHLIPHPLSPGAAFAPTTASKDKPILPIAIRLDLVLSGKESPVMDQRLAFVVS